MKVIACLVVILLAVSAFVYRRHCACGEELGPREPYVREAWPDAFKLVRDKFPTVKQLSTRELATWLNDKQKPQPVLLDTRADKEFVVSHLPNARHAADETQALSVLSGYAKDAPIVVYCSIGYRSSELAQKLTARGYTNVQNLEGSIFMWANEGRPLQRGSETVTVVHPFDEKWGRLLERTRWSFEAN